MGAKGHARKEAQFWRSITSGESFKQGVGAGREHACKQHAWYANAWR